MVKLIIALLAALACLGIVSHLTGHTSVGLVVSGAVFMVALMKK